MPEIALTAREFTIDKSPLAAIGSCIRCRCIPRDNSKFTLVEDLWIGRDIFHDCR